MHERKRGKEIRLRFNLPISFYYPEEIRFIFNFLLCKTEISNSVADTRKDVFGIGSSVQSIHFDQCKANPIINFRIACYESVDAFRQFIRRNMGFLTFLIIRKYIQRLQEEEKLDFVVVSTISKCQIKVKRNHCIKRHLEVAGEQAIKVPPTYMNTDIKERANNQIYT